MRTSFRGRALKTAAVGRHKSVLGAARDGNPPSHGRQPRPPLPLETAAAAAAAARTTATVSSWYLLLHTVEQGGGRLLARRDAPKESAGVGESQRVV